MTLHFRAQFTDEKARQFDITYFMTESFKYFGLEIAILRIEILYAHPSLLEVYCLSSVYSRHSLL